MDLQITHRNISEPAHRALAGKFHNLATKHLDRLVAHFPTELVSLRIVAEKSKHHSDLHTVRLRLTVPGGQFTSEKTAYSLEAAAKGAFSALETQVIEHLERVRGDDDWKRMKRREQLRRLRAAVSERPPEHRVNFREAIRPHLSMLRRLARFEISHLRARGHLMSDYPSVDDMTDEVLARAYRHPDLLQNRAEVLPKLHRILMDVAKEEAAHDRIRRRMLSLQAPPRREPTDIEIDETFYDFFQPDDLTKVENLAADPSPDPEDIVSTNEMRQCLAAAIWSMPAAWRRAITLARIESMPLSAVARVLNTSEEEVRDWLDRAEIFLRTRLADEGLLSFDINQLSSLAKERSKAASEMEAAFDNALDPIAQPALPP